MWLKDALKKKSPTCSVGDGGLLSEKSVNLQKSSEFSDVCGDEKRLRKIEGEENHVQKKNEGDFYLYDFGGEHCFHQ